MRNGIGPFAEPAWRKRLAHNILAPVFFSKSGEITANTRGNPVCSPRFAGEVTDVWLSVKGSGKDDTNPLSLAGQVYINGTAVCSTPPAIAHVSGEAAQQKTTVVTGDTGITQAVINKTNAVFSPGDIIQVDLNMTRTSSPTTEMNNPCIVVELEPYK